MSVLIFQTEAGLEAVNLPEGPGGFIVGANMGPPGPPGLPGAGATVFEYTMPAAQASTGAITHGLGRDPIAVQVFDESGVLCDGYSLSFPNPGVTVLIGFDISIQAHIRLQ